MKIFLGITCATALFMAAASAQTSPTTSPTGAAQTTSSTDESVGIVTEFTPGLSIVLNTGTGEPVRYKFGKSVTYMNAKGKVVKESKIRKDRKVRVHYVKEGNDLVADKVTIVKD